MERRVVELNPFQAAISHAARMGIKQIDAECGRGTGKSFGLADIIRMMAVGMPRGKVALSGPSIRSMLGDTLPSTIEAMEKLGVHKGVHYVIGNDSMPKRQRWPEPFQPPADYSNYIRFHTGFALGLVSQDKSTIEHRGHNWDGELGDERASLDPERLFNEVSAGNRTRRREFENFPLYHAAIYVGSTPMNREGLHWLAGEEYAREHPDKALWIRANAWQVNRHNLQADWFEVAERKALSPMHYAAEVMNVRPRLTVNGFYPALTKAHYYSATDADYFIGRHVDGKPFMNTSAGDLDCGMDLPLIVDYDPGSKINFVVVKQIHEAKRELRTLKSFWQKYPITMQTVHREAIAYYAGQRKKLVKLFCGRDANMRRADSNRTLSEEVADLWRKAGWEVHMMTQRVGITFHDEKYHILVRVHEEKDKRLYKSRINRENNRDLIVSLEHAEAKDAMRGGVRSIRKDKSSEARLGSVPAQHATHGSDAYDFSEVYYAKVKMAGVEGAFRDVIVR